MISATLQGLDYLRPARRLTQAPKACLPQLTFSPLDLSAAVLLHPPGDSGQPSGAQCRAPPLQRPAVQVCSQGSLFLLLRSCAQWNAASTHGDGRAQLATSIV